MAFCDILGHFPHYRKVVVEGRRFRDFFESVTFCIILSHFPCYRKVERWGNRLGVWPLMCSVAQAFLSVKSGPRIRTRGIHHRGRRGHRGGRGGVLGSVDVSRHSRTLTLALSRERERGSNDGWLGCVSVNSWRSQNELVLLAELEQSHASLKL